MVRNKEQADTYISEDAARKHFLPSPAAREYLTPPNDASDLTGYIRHVQGTDWFQAAFPNQDDPIEVKARRGDTVPSVADSANRIIRIAPGHRETAHIAEWTLLHELAHIITRDLAPYLQPKAYAEGHHHAFRWNYVLLIWKMLGHRAAKYLRSSFIKHELTI
jgi:putative metallohydrolase (TIGR04338 family)